MSKFITFLIILMGASCCIGQVLLIREFLIVFYGNELIIGVILANWLLLEAAGSFTFGLFSSKLSSPKLVYALTQVSAGILFPLSIYGARIVKNILTASPGEGIGLWPIAICSLAIMMPLGFLLGGQFPLICQIYKQTKNTSLTQAIGKSYFLEAVGFGLAGIILTFLLIPYINSMNIAFLMSGINILSAYTLLTLKSKKTIHRYAFPALVIILLLGYFNFSDTLEKQSLREQWKSFNLIEYRNSIYGNIAVTQQEEQYVFYYDGMSFMTIPTPDIVFTQDIVNFPLGIAQTHKNILVLGSGLGGIISNILKFPVEQVHYAELDPLVIRMAQKYKTELTEKELNDPRLHIHHVDGRLFLKNTNNTFDVIIMNLPAPATLQINRFYTQEFFNLAKQKLTNAGLICFSLPGSLSYLSNEQIDINNCAINTMNSVFPHTEVIPGYYNILLASEENILLSPEQIAAKLNKYSIDSPLFTDFYIKERLNPERKQWFNASLEKRPSRINKDLEPIGVFYGLGLWSALFTPGFQKIFANASNWSLAKGIVFILLVTIIIFFISRGKKKKPALPIPLMVLFSGFSGLALNLIFLLSLQTFYGYVYLYIGLLISAFMIGITSGGMLMTKQLDKIKMRTSLLLKVEGLFIVFSLACIPALLGLQTYLRVSSAIPLTIPILFILSVFAGFMVGFEFPLANKIYLENSNKNILYAVDMLGSFIGAIFVSIFLIPILGIINTILLIAVIKICVFILLSASLFLSAPRCL
ncbi:MAG: methyltransferase [Candidatus Omnitrophota bacterium]